MAEKNGTRDICENESLVYEEKCDIIIIYPATLPQQSDIICIYIYIFILMVLLVFKN